MRTKPVGLKKRGLTKQEQKEKKHYEDITAGLYKKANCIVEKERRVATYFGGKLRAIPHDLFNKTSDVVALAKDGVHLVAVTSGSPHNVKDRKDFFDANIPDYSYLICEVWHYAENNDFVIERRTGKVWHFAEFNFELIGLENRSPSVK
jgi:hypothetical protein